MKKLFVLAGLFFLLLIQPVFAVELETGKEYFLRTALHAVRGDEIYWVNYTDKSEHIRAGEKVLITEITGHVIKFKYRDKEYNFAFTEKRGQGSPELYAKFFTKENIAMRIEKYGEAMKSKIGRGKVENGMTKEQVLFAVGCPAVVDKSKTYNFTLKEIISSDLWIYYFNRFNRWAVQFANGKVVSINN